MCLTTAMSGSGPLKKPGGKSKKDSLRFIVVNLFSAPSQTVPCRATGPWDFIVVPVPVSVVDDDGDNSWVKPWNGQAGKSLKLWLAPLPLIPRVPHSNIKRRSSEVPLCGGEVWWMVVSSRLVPWSWKSRNRAGMPRGPLLLTSGKYPTQRGSNTGEAMRRRCSGRWDDDSLETLRHPRSNCLMLVFAYFSTTPPR